MVNNASAFSTKTVTLDKPILIVDDETDIRFLINTMLRQHKFNTVLAANLAEAKQIIEEQEKSFSLIFLDNHLPDGRGVDYIRRIKEKCPQCKVIMITAHDNLTDRELAKREGADHFIGKPFTRDLILRTIERFSS